MHAALHQQNRSSRASQYQTADVSDPPDADGASTSDGVERLPRAVRGIFECIT